MPLSETGGAFVLKNQSQMHESLSKKRWKKYLVKILRLLLRKLEQSNKTNTEERINK